MRRPILAIVLIIFCLSFLASCAPKINSDPSAQAVEGYLNALIKKDSARVSGLACKEWAEQASLELDSFQSVTAKLDGLVCKKHGTDGNFTLVNCQGKIIATYNSEEQALDLAPRIYRTIEEGGGWRVCGYQ